MTEPEGGRMSLQILADQKTAATAPERCITTRHSRFSDLPPSLTVLSKHPKYLTTYLADMPKLAKAFCILLKNPVSSVCSPWSDPLAHGGLLQNFGGTLVFPVLPMVTPLVVCVCMTLRRACILFSRLLIMFNRTLLSICNNIFYKHALKWLSSFLHFFSLIINMKYCKLVTSNSTDQSYQILWSTRFSEI